MEKKEEEKSSFAFLFILIVSPGIQDILNTQQPKHNCFLLYNASILTQESGIWCLVYIFTRNKKT